MAQPLQEQLEKLGLSDKEAIVYLALLQRQSASAAEIANHTGLQRTTVYSVLEKLRKESLVTLLNSMGRKRYLCESPERFGERLDAQRKIFWNVLPELRENASLFTQKNAFSYHEGLAGIWQVYDAMLQEKGELRQLIPSITEARIVGSEKIDSFIKARVRRGISVRAIIQNDKELEKEYMRFNDEQLRRVRVVDKKTFPIHAEITLFAENSVAFIAPREGSAVLLKSEDIFTTMSGIFETLWNSLPEKL